MLVAPRVVKGIHPDDTFGPGTYFSLHGMRDIIPMVESLITMEAVSFRYCDETGITILWRSGNIYRCLDVHGNPADVVLNDKIVSGPFTMPPVIRIELTNWFNGENNNIRYVIPRIRYSCGDPPCWNATKPEHCAALDNITFAFPTSARRIMLRLKHSNPTFEYHPDWQAVRLIAHARHGLRADGAIICIEPQAPASGDSNQLFRGGFTDL